MDSERTAEFKHDKEEIPGSIIDRAREELREKALDELTFQQVEEALAEINDELQTSFVKTIKFNFPVFAGGMVIKHVKKYLEPSQESVQQRAEEILAELDDRKGEDI